MSFSELDIYKPSKPLLEPERFLRRYDKKRPEKKRPEMLHPEGKQSDENQRGPLHAITEERAEAARRRERRRNDPARALRRRQQLSESYTTAIEQISTLGDAQAMLQPVSELGKSEVEAWLPKNTVHVFLGLCTLGPDLDDHMRKLTEEDLAAASVLNEVALAWIVAITQEMRERIGAKVKSERCRVGAAYRPGLGRWPLQVQHTIFANLPTAKIGVTLTESLLMLPSYSTSVVIPVLVDQNERSS